MSLVTQLDYLDRDNPRQGRGLLGQWAEQNLPGTREFAGQIAATTDRIEAVRPYERQDLGYYGPVGGMWGQRLAWLIEPSPPYAALLGAIAADMLTDASADMATACWRTHSIAENPTPRGLGWRTTPSGWWIVPDQRRSRTTGQPGVLENFEAMADLTDELRVGQLGDDEHELGLLPALAYATSLEGVYRAGHSPAYEFDENVLTADWRGLLHKNRTGHALRTARTLVKNAGTAATWGHGSPTLVSNWADADVLLGPHLDGGYTLLDIKTVTSARDLDRVMLWLWQILGYALLDVTDRWRIRRIGLWLTRHGLILHWPVDQALQLMARGGRWEKTPQIDALRAHFLPHAMNAIAQDGGTPPVEWMASQVR